MPYLVLRQSCFLILSIFHSRGCAGGVGKTAIMELLAQRMVAGDVPASIADCELWSLDIGALVAGTKFHGSLEERIKGVLDEVKAANGKIILCVDECHLIMNAGASTGGINAANLLKPMVRRTTHLLRLSVAAAITAPSRCCSRNFCEAAPSFRAPFVLCPAWLALAAAASPW